MKNLIYYLIFTFCSLAFVFASHAQDGDIDAQRLWKKNCRKCHDADGSGGTPAGKKLKVDDYTKSEVQKKFTDEEGIKVIKEGVTDENGEELMKAYPEFSDAELAALVSLIRSFEVPE